MWQTGNWFLHHIVPVNAALSIHELLAGKYYNGSLLPTVFIGPCPV